YRLSDVLTPELFAQHDELIRNFLVFEHIPFDPQNLPDTQLTERKIRELVEEIAAETGAAT
ncbi:MAG TPA: hypothetical protein VFF59_09785, partial [Anaerolineae bacterium]|nr:hypothetical protein [Anaerolineae bacterium]